MKLKSTASKKKATNKAFRNNLVNKNKLTPHLEKAIAEGEFHWEYKFEGKVSDDAWHPSGHCTPSINDLYHFAVEGHKDERKFTPALLKTFQVGHFWHQYLQWIVLHRLEFCDPSSIERKGRCGWGTGYIHDHSDVEEFDPFHWVTGSADVAPCEIPGQGEFVIDYKTMGNHDYRRPGLPDWCANKYEAQINIYMDFFDLEHGLVIPIQKDSPHDFREFEFERNQPLIDAIYEKWHIVSYHLDENEAPNPDDDIELPFKGPVEQ